MGYFPNGTAGDLYRAQYCERCVHDGDHNEDPMCPIWVLHLERNFTDCNNPESLLHRLIPKEPLDNGQCVMFIEDPHADQLRLDLETP